MANTRESFPLFHMVAFHTSHVHGFHRARCLNLPLLNFLFSSLPATKNKGYFLLPCNKQHLSLARPTSEGSCANLPGVGLGAQLLLGTVGFLPSNATHCITS